MGPGVYSASASAIATAPARVRLSSSGRRLLLWVSDSIALAMSVAAVVALGITGASSLPDAPAISFLVFMAIWSISAAVFDCYEPRVAGRAVSSVAAAWRALFATAVAYFTVQLAVPGLIPPLSGTLLGPLVWLTVGLAGLAIGRVAHVRLVARTDARRRIAVVGTPATWRAASELLRTIEVEYEVAGLVAKRGVGVPDDGANMLGPELELVRIVREHAIDEIIVTDAGEDASTMDALIAPYESGVTVRHLSDVFEEVSGRIPVRWLRPHWFAVLPRRPGGGSAYDFVRRSIDVVAAGIALILAAPLLAAIALAISLDSRGPVIYRQEREGYRGRCFTMLKFRTMRADAEQSGPTWAATGDPRRTRVGRFLRPTRLDELPNLWNVLRGDMTIIGPRPERPCFATELGQTIPFFRARTLVRPGITGWAQVRFAYAGSAEDALEKLQYDLYYVKHRSPFLDLVIALKTVGVLLRASGR